ncbi:hypothetical protein [Mesoterricola silvestris]|uniref:Uncharacterized protein n=1 Tax=Mesoterricola silvestris TaxID=2927979 RepID=A0AA48GIC5_9BACT|nr:hypothetical protein [Mesoterricola silvestris]BDU71544.1 hypothetical protein METEAL_07180 [Mesoterricola silvestris]
MKTTVILNTVLGSDSANSFLKQFKNELDLPFVPTPGQDLSPVVWLKFRVSEVVYDIQANSVEVTGEHCAGFDREGHDLEHIASTMAQAGWQAI